jgi:hypothetical protein
MGTIHLCWILTAVWGSADVVVVEIEVHAQPLEVRVGIINSHTHMSKCSRFHAHL